MSSIGRNITSLTTPALVVDKVVTENNCKNMLDRASACGITVRGQTKTHKTVEGALLQTGGTKRKLVTSTLVECEMYADAGFEDILYGFPLIPAHLERVYNLRERLDMFHVMLVNKQIFHVLQDTQPPSGKKWSVILGVDTGNQREGVWWEEPELFELAQLIHQASNMDFRGVYAHCGNSYKSKSVEQVHGVRDAALNMICNVAEKLKTMGIECKDVGIGSTPSCSHSSPSLSRLTEIHPGNYVFYDNQQRGLGSCQDQDISAKVLTRVIGHYPSRGQLLIDCGFAGLTKQGQGSQDHPDMIARIEDHPQLMVSNMTQEIGFVEMYGDQSLDFSKFPIGCLLKLIPYHACATAACYPVYYVHDKEGFVVEEWRPCRGW